MENRFQFRSTESLYLALPLYQKKTFAVEADLINVILQKSCNLIRISETLPLFASTKIQSVSIY